MIIPISNMNLQYFIIDDNKNLLYLQLRDFVDHRFKDIIHREVRGSLVHRKRSCGS